MPLPEVVHVPPVAPPPTVPPKPADETPEQTVWDGPALAVAAGRTVSTTPAVAGPQGELWPVVRKVKVTVPVEPSAADAV